MNSVLHHPMDRMQSHTTFHLEYNKSKCWSMGINQVVGGRRLHTTRNIAQINLRVAFDWRGLNELTGT